MPPSHRPIRIPKLRRHKPSGRAVVTVLGADHYLGPWPAGQRKPPAAVKDRYDQLITRWLAGGLSPAGRDAPGITVAQLIERFWAFAEQHYRRPDGTTTHELEGYRVTLRPLRHLYGAEAAADFGPLKLKAVRQVMVTGYRHPKHGDQPGLSRGVVNHRVRRIVRVFKWAVSEELVPEAVWSALRSVRGLQAGRSEAYETDPVTPVSIAHVEATLPHLLPPVRAMVRVQMLTGMRPGEACAMRTCDLDTAGAVWLYRPASHKTQHHGKTRVIAVGPRAQEVLKPFLKADLAAPLFSPREAKEIQLEERGKKRKTPLHYGNRPGTNRKRKPKRAPGDRYTVVAYGRAVRRAAELANRAQVEERRKAGEDIPEGAVLVPAWHPHQLRHTAATEVRRHFGIEAAQHVLGHSNISTAELYAEKNLAVAVQVARAIG